MASVYEQLREDARALLDISLSPRQIEAFTLYTQEMLAWNKRFNLTAITDPQEIVIKHFLDSLSCVLGMGVPPYGRVVDVGTGAGFPGLPLKIVYPHLALSLVESIGKKASFCRHLVRELGLSDVDVLHARAEEVGRMPGHRASYDWALARAVAPMGVLVEYLLPLLNIGGVALALKGETGPAEAHAAESAIHILGGRLTQLTPVELPRVVESRFLVMVKKVAETPEKFPRRPGFPSKRPLA